MLGAAEASADTPAITNRKEIDSNDVKMTVFAKGDQVPMNATVRPSGNNVTVEIVQGGGVPAKAVEILHGTCAKPGPQQFRLPPFASGQYTAVAKNVTTAQLLDGQHALVVWGSNGKTRTMYACGDMVKPNAFIH